MSVWSAPLCLCTTCMPGVHWGQKRASESWNRSYRQLWAAMWVLRIEQKASRRGESALNPWPIYWLFFNCRSHTPNNLLDTSAWWRMSFCMLWMYVHKCTLKTLCIYSKAVFTKNFSNFCKVSLLLATLRLQRRKTNSPTLHTSLFQGKYHSAGVGIWFGSPLCAGLSRVPSWACRVSSPSVVEVSLTTTTGDTACDMLQLLPYGDST